VCGIIGPNGAGKTTLLRLLAGLLAPTRGEVRIEGRSMAELPRREVARKVAMMFQTMPPLSGFRVREIVAMGRYPHAGLWDGPSEQDGNAIEAALDAAGIRDLAARKHQELSGGEQQLVQLARALAQAPSVLLMDEPTANLDVRHRHVVGERVRALARGGLAVVVATHDLNAVRRVCDRAAILFEGKVVAEGAPGEVLTPDRMREAFGIEP
jgi:iron complex transport system ATP-binding protein